MERKINDVKNSWKVIMTSAIWAILLGFIFLLVVRLCAGFIIWSSIIVVIVGLFSFGLVLMKTKTVIPYGQMYTEDYLV